MFWGSSSTEGPSSSSSGAASIIIRFCGYCWFRFGWVVILVSSRSLIQLSESFQTTTFTFTSTRHVTIDHIQQHPKGHFCQTFPTNVGQSVRRHVGITVLSSQQQQNTIEEKEKPTTKTKRRSWEESYQLLVSYKEKHGNCNVPRSHKEDPRLARWVDSQRQRKDTLSDERIEKLDDLGFSWSEKQRAWEESFQLLVSYKEQHGNCNVPNRYKEDRRFGIWVKSQRQQKEKGSLNDERIAKLDDLGFSWANEINKEQWDKMFQKLVQYAKENNGDCNIPSKENDDNKELFLWARTQRLRKSLLSKEHRTKLDNLGLIWEDADKVKADQKWNEQYESLKDYKEEHGHCLVPKRWEDDPTLGRWVSNQRTLYKKGLLPEDRQMKLEEMDFTWKVRDRNTADYAKLDSKWFVKFGILHNFLEEHGHCNVPNRYKKDNSLGLWVVTQRQKQMKGDLPQDRKELLDDIGFTWSFNDQKDEQWNEKYQELKTFKDTNGHLRLPETSAILSDWSCRQRIMFAAGKVTPERKALLDEIEFRWEIQNSSS